MQVQLLIYLRDSLGVACLVGALEVLVVAAEVVQSKERISLFYLFIFYVDFTYFFTNILHNLFILIFGYILCTKLLSAWRTYTKEKHPNWLLLEILFAQSALGMFYIFHLCIFMMTTK